MPVSDFNSRFDSALSDLSSAIRADERCRIDAEVWPLRLAAERSRIRKELLAEARSECPLGASPGGEADFFAERLQALAYRVCPPEEEAQDGTSSPSTTSSTQS